MGCITDDAFVWMEECIDAALLALIESSVIHLHAAGAAVRRRTPITWLQRDEWRHPHD